jgi:myosin heavy subunit
VTGESGAGKTETVKIVMMHLATVQQSRPGGEAVGHSTAQDIVSRVCKSSPLFEAFGNAKTSRNDNSSRFGKFTQLQYELEPTEVARLGGRKVPYTDLVGSTCITYLLEKSRVVFHAQGERTYHIFYQLLAAPREFKEELWSWFGDCTLTDFAYLAQSGNLSHMAHSSDDGELWHETRDALDTFHFTGDSLCVLMRALAIVLQLGNLIFEKERSLSDFEEHNTIISSRKELERLSEMIGIDRQELEETMTSRILKTPGNEEDVKVKLSPQVAKEACDALAKEIYARIFDLMVKKINEYTTFADLGRRTFGHISLLDIFGFERFDVNRFEQLCINYTNERLHNKYVVDNFNQIKDEYAAEGVDLYDFALVDNSDILELLEGRNGIITSLNEECLRPQRNAESFVYNNKIAHKNSRRLIDKKLHQKYEFGIQHFAGPVEYNADKFVERNMDKIPDSLVECASKSTNSLIRTEFVALLSTRDGLTDSPSNKNKKATNTVLGKFRSQLNSLMAAMKDTPTRYIRCIKPNNDMVPRLTQHGPTLHQLECSGLVTAIQMTRESFPSTLPYEFILSRYACLMVEKDFVNIGSMKLKDKVNHVLSKWLKSLSTKNRDGTRTMPFACGKTKVYFKAGCKERLEFLRLEYFHNHAITLQKAARRLLAMAKLFTARSSVIRLQAVGRMVKESKRFGQKRHAATCLAAWTRGRFAIQLVEGIRREQKKAATKIQSHYRTFLAVNLVQKMRIALDARLLSLAEEAQQTDTKLMTMSHNVAAVNIEQRESPPKELKVLFDDGEQTFIHSRVEVEELQGKNNELKSNLEAVQEERRALAVQTENSVATVTSFQKQLEDITKVNDRLVQETFKYRHEVGKLKRSFQTKQLQTTHKLMVAENELDRVSTTLEAEVKALSTTLKVIQKSANEESNSLRHDLSMQEEKHKLQVGELEIQLRTTQDSHREYLTKLMGVLETTQSNRSEEMERTSAELEAIKTDKNRQIVALTRQVQMFQKEAQQQRETHFLPVQDIQQIRNQMNKGSEARTRRHAQFDSIVQDLATLTDATVADETGARMTEMTDILAHLYKMEEDAHSKIDEKSLGTMETYVALSQPNETVKELQKRVALMEAETAKLREELRAKEEPCRRCASIDNRRATRLTGEGRSDHR